MSRACGQQLEVASGVPAPVAVDPLQAELALLAGRCTVPVAVVYLITAFSYGKSKKLDAFMGC